MDGGGRAKADQAKARDQAPAATPAQGASEGEQSDNWDAEGFELPSVLQHTTSTANNDPEPSGSEHRALQTGLQYAAGRAGHAAQRHMPVSKLTTSDADLAAYASEQVDHCLVDPSTPWVHVDRKMLQAVLATTIAQHAMTLRVQRMLMQVMQQLEANDRCPVLCKETRTRAGGWWSRKRPMSTRKQLCVVTSDVVLIVQPEGNAGPGGTKGGRATAVTTGATVTAWPSRKSFAKWKKEQALAFFLTIYIRRSFAKWKKATFQEYQLHTMDGTVLTVTAVTNGTVKNVKDAAQKQQPLFVTPSLYLLGRESELLDATLLAALPDPPVFFLLQCEDEDEDENEECERVSEYELWERAMLEDQQREFHASAMCEDEEELMGQHWEWEDWYEYEYDDMTDAWLELHQTRASTTLREDRAAVREAGEW